MTNRNARWFKVVGGDFGTVKIGGKWRRYSCLICLKRQAPGLTRSELRWQGPPSGAIQRAMRDPVFFPCGGARSHNAVAGRQAAPRKKGGDGFIPTEELRRATFYEPHKQ